MLKKVATLILTLVVLFTTTGYSANELILLITESGYYHIKIDAEGVPTTTKYTQVIKVNNPPENPPENPETPNTFRKTIEVATEKVKDPNKDNIKKALAELYRAVAGLPLNETKDLKAATKAMFQALQLSAEWNQWIQTIETSVPDSVSLDVAKKQWIIVAEVLGQN